MAQEKGCLRCGAAIPIDAPEGLCMRCLMQVAMSEGAKATVQAPAGIEGPGTTIGRYELLELTGEGGMGLVYLAQQKEPVRRRVAFKIIKPGMDSRQVIARFEAERQALALLDHPNIAHVFDAGTTETGRPYFVMEYVKGMSVTRYCDDNKLAIEQRLRLFEQVCEAVHHAHQKGIIHRDLKPSNILVSIHGDRAVPKIIDFGIAKAITQPLTDKTFVTFQGQLLGTPEYMSPEQVDLATQDIDTRSDIYSLGVVLYELLAGVLPFESEAFEHAGLAEIQQTIREMEPASPSIRLTSLGEQAKAIAASRGTQVLPLARRLHRELEWIPLKAMRKDRCRRYKSASDMADDVRNYLNGNPLLAGPETTIYRVQKFVRKHAGSVMTVALVAAVILLGLVVSIWQATVATNAKNEALRAKVEKDRQAQIALEERDKAVVAQQQAEEQRQRAEVSERQAQNLHYMANMTLAQQAWEQNNMGRLRQLLEETAAYPQRGFEWYYWQRQAHLSVRTLCGHNDVIWSVAFSPDGRLVVTGSSDGTAKVWDAVSAKEILTLGDNNIGRLAFYPDLDTGEETASFGAAAFSPDGQRLCMSSWYGTAKVWEVNSGKELLSLGRHEHGICSIAFSLDGRRLVTGSYDSTAKVWDARTGVELLTLQGHRAPITSVAFSPDGQRIVTGSADMTARIWEATSGKEMLTIEGYRSPIMSVVFSPDGQRVVTAGVDGTTKFWDVTSAKEVLALEGHRLPVFSVAFSPDGERIITGSWDQTARMWEVASGKELFSLKGHNSPIFGVAFSPDGREVITGSSDGTAKIWEVTGGRERILRRSGSGIRSVGFSPDGQRLCTGSSDGTAEVWDVASGTKLFSLEAHTKRVRSVAFSPDSQWLVTASYDGSAKVWDTGSGTELLSLTGHNDRLTSVAFSPGGRRIVTGSWDETAKVWEAHSGQELLTLQGHNARLHAVAFSPDGRQIATGGYDGTTRIWDAANGKELLTLKHDGFGAAWSVAFSPDGQKVLTGGNDLTARIWEVTTGKELLTLHGHTLPITSVAFSPDGQRVVTSGYDHAAKVWEANSGKGLLTLKGQRDMCFVAALSPDGRQIATGGEDGTLKIWETASAQQVATWQQEKRALTEWKAALQREQDEATERYKTLRAQDPGAIKQWLVLMPRAVDDPDKAVSVVAPEQQLTQEATLSPRAGECITVGEIERIWQEVQLEDNLIDFNHLLGTPSNNDVAYAVSYIDSEAEFRDLLMKVGVGGSSIKIYLNAQEIYPLGKFSRGDAWYTAEARRIELKAGRNVLVLKIVNLENNWRASIRLTDAAGQPVKRIRVTLEPPEETLP